VPAREAAAEGFADEDRAEDERRRPGYQVDVKGPAIRAIEIGLAAEQKIRVEIGRQIIAITDEDGERDLAN
jgi:hypothetical protein